MIYIPSSLYPCICCKYSCDVAKVAWNPSKSKLMSHIYIFFAFLYFKVAGVVSLMTPTFKYLAGIAGPSGYGSRTTAERIAQDCFGFMETSHLTAIVTGATSGIGAETARVLANSGVRVVIPARDLKKAEKVKESVQMENPQARIVVMEMDLSSFASIRGFASEFLSSGMPLHILINNAGKYSQKLEFSEDKFEITFATNYLGHFLLTEMLLEKMVETSSENCIQGRIVNVSSAIHNWIDSKNFCFDKIINPQCYDATRAYAQSKLANILHAKELARQLEVRNANITANAVNPGIAKTEIIRDYRGFLTDSLYFVAAKLLKSISQAAATTCYVALNYQTAGMSGRYFSDCNESRCSSLANGEPEARKLWDQTRTLIHRRLLQPSAKMWSQHPSKAP